MPSERWQQLEQLFAEAVALPVDRREAFVEGASGADTGLRDELAALLATVERAGPFLSSTALDVFARQISREGWSVRPGDLMHLLHAGKSGQTFAEGAVGGRIDLDKHEGGQPLAEGIRVEANLVSLNDTALFELANALQNRRWRHPHLAGDLGIGNTRLLLKDVQYLQVNFVDYS